MSKPNCYKCTHRRQVEGSTHSSCHHPSVKDITTSQLAMLLAALGYHIDPKEVTGQDAITTGDKHGIEKGWFNWPMDFDPVWLKTCKGFEKKS